MRVGVAHHLLERHPFCDSPINIVVCLIACQFAALVTVRQPIFNRPSTATSTILQPPSNHHLSASRQSFVRHSAAPIHPPRTRTSPTLHTPSPHQSAAPTIRNRPSTAKSTTSQQSFYRLPTTTHTLLALASSNLPRQARTSSSGPRRAETSGNLNPYTTALQPPHLRFTHSVPNNGHSSAIPKMSKYMRYLDAMSPIRVHLCPTIALIVPI